MKITIKTIARKELVVDFDEEKTVFDLKSALELSPDVGVEPEFQRLIYGGKVLSDADTLKVYHIQEDKFLVVLRMKMPPVVKPTTPPPRSRKTPHTPKTPPQGPPTPIPTSPYSTNLAILDLIPIEDMDDEEDDDDDDDDDGVEGEDDEGDIPISDTSSEPTAMDLSANAAEGQTEANAAPVGTGLNQPDHSRTLTAANANDAARAIEFLIECMPEDLGADQANNFNNHEANHERGHGNNNYDTNNNNEPIDIDNPTPTPQNAESFEEVINAFRNDPLYHVLRESVMPDTSMLDMVIQRVCNDNPELLDLVMQNRDTFLRALHDDEIIDEDEDEEDEDEMEEDEDVVDDNINNEDGDDDDENDNGNGDINENNNHSHINQESV